MLPSLCGEARSVAISETPDHMESEQTENEQKRKYTACHSKATMTRALAYLFSAAQLS